MLDADDSDQTLTNIVAREAVVFQQILFLRIAIDTTRQGASQARHVGSTVLVADDVGVALDAFTEGV